MYSPEFIYSQAYSFHYKKKKYGLALALYKITIDNYPDSTEAKYSDMQIKYIKSTKQIELSMITPEENELAMNISEASIPVAAQEFSTTDVGKSESSIEDALRIQSYRDIETIKNLLVFFAVLWGIGVLFSIIIALSMRN